MEEIRVNDIVRFSEIWDGKYDGRELLESGSYYCYENDTFYDFEVVEEDENPLEVKIKITEITSGNMGEW